MKEIKKSFKNERAQRRKIPVSRAKRCGKGNALMWWANREQVRIERKRGRYIGRIFYLCEEIPEKMRNSYIRRMLFSNALFLSFPLPLSHSNMITQLHLRLICSLRWHLKISIRVRKQSNQTQRDTFT